MSKPYYTIITYNVRNDDRLSASEKLFYGDLAGLSRNEGYCFATNEWLAKTFNQSARTIRDWLEHLEECGHIKRVYSPCNTKRRIYVALEELKKSIPWQKSARGVAEKCHHISNTNNIERDEATPKHNTPVKDTSNLTPEKEDLFKDVVKKVPSNILPHDEILSVLQEKENSSADIAGALAYLYNEYTRHNKRTKANIASYIALFRTKVKKLRNLRLYEESQHE